VRTVVACHQPAGDPRARHHGYLIDAMHCYFVPSHGSASWSTGLLQLRLRLYKVSLGKRQIENGVGMRSDVIQIPTSDPLVSLDPVHFFMEGWIVIPHLMRVSRRSLLTELAQRSQGFPIAPHSPGRGMAVRTIGPATQGEAALCGAGHIDSVAEHKSSDESGVS
jgi:hypothetical protein